MATTRKSERSETDAIEMLKADHKAVKDLFKKFAALKADGDTDNQEEKSSVVQEICTALTVHTAIEEEIFYPAVRKAIDDEALMDEALVEHASAKAHSDIRIRPFYPNTAHFVEVFAPSRYYGR